MGKRAGENREDGQWVTEGSSRLWASTALPCPQDPRQHFTGQLPRVHHQVQTPSPLPRHLLTFPVNPGWGCADKGNTQDLKTQVRKSYLQAKRVRDPSEWSAQALVFSRDVWCASTLSSWKQINSNCDPVKVCFSGESWNMPAASINKQRYLWILNVSAIFSKHTHLLGDES